MIIGIRNFPLSNSGLEEKHVIGSKNTPVNKVTMMNSMKKKAAVNSFL